MVPGVTLYSLPKTVSDMSTRNVIAVIVDLWAMFEIRVPHLTPANVVAAVAVPARPLAMAQGEQVRGRKPGDGPPG